MPLFVDFSSWNLTVLVVLLSQKVRESTGNPAPLPLLVKIAPDLSLKEKKEIAAVVVKTKASAKLALSRQFLPLSCPRLFSLFHHLSSLSFIICPRLSFFPCLPLFLPVSVLLSLSRSLAISPIPFIYRSLSLSRQERGGSYCHVWRYGKLALLLLLVKIPNQLFPKRGLGSRDIAAEAGRHPHPTIDKDW